MRCPNGRGAVFASAPQVSAKVNLRQRFNHFVTVTRKCRQRHCTPPQLQWTTSLNLQELPGFLSRKATPPNHDVAVARICKQIHPCLYVPLSCRRHPLSRENYATSKSQMPDSKPKTMKPETEKIRKHGRKKTPGKRPTLLV